MSTTAWRVVFVVATALFSVFSVYQLSEVPYVKRALPPMAAQHLKQLAGVDSGKLHMLEKEYSESKSVVAAFVVHLLIVSYIGALKCLSEIKFMQRKYQQATLHTLVCSGTCVLSAYLGANLTEGATWALLIINADIWMWVWLWQIHEDLGLLINLPKHVWYLVFIVPVLMSIPKYWGEILKDECWPWILAKVGVQTTSMRGGTPVISTGVVEASGSSPRSPRSPQPTKRGPHRSTKGGDV